jgi:hypothetical protein
MLDLPTIEPMLFSLSILVHDHVLVESEYPSLSLFSVKGSILILGSLANLEMRIILARLVWKFDLRIAPSSEKWLADQKVHDVWGKPPLNVYLTPVEKH